MKQTRGYLLLICIVSAMGGLLFGYDWVVIGGAKIFYEPFFGIENSAALRGWAMSSALIGCLAGALLSGIWSDKYGRKKMLVIASFLFALSAWGTGAVDHFPTSSSIALWADWASASHPTFLPYILQRYLLPMYAANSYRSTSSPSY